MSSAYTVTVPVSVEPVTLTEAKSYLRIDFTDDDTLITRLITTARQYAESVTHRALGVQTIQIIETIERPEGGELSGPIQNGPNWYRYQEQLGANPFGAAMFYFDIALPPCLSVVSVETRVTVWDAWQTFNGIMTLDAVPEPARLYFQVPITANQWRFTVQCGYDGVTKFLPADIKQAILEIIAFWYDNREGEKLPDGLLSLLQTHKVDWM